MMSMYSRYLGYSLYICYRRQGNISIDITRHIINIAIVIAIVFVNHHHSCRMRCILRYSTMTIHRDAAVVRPFTTSAPVRTIAPAPRKPMPDTACEARREMSTLLKRRGDNERRQKLVVT